MNRTFTNPVLFLIFSMFVLYSCTVAAQENDSKDTASDNSENNEQVFTFHKEKNGNDNAWKAVFKDGRLTELYKNGDKIPYKYLEDYTDMVDEELEGAQSGDSYFCCHPFTFNFDMRNFDSTFSKMGNNWGNMSWAGMDSVFNSEQFRKNMDTLKNNMKMLKHMKFAFKFDSSGFNKSMKDLRKNLRKLKVHPPVFVCPNMFPGCDMEAFKKGMADFDYEMQHNRIFRDGLKIDMSEFDDNMKDFDKSMKNFDLHMKDFDKDMKKLDGFLKDLRHELVKDKVIKNEDEDFSLKFNSGEILINGKKLSNDLLKKYKSLYKTHFGKNIDDEFKIDDGSVNKQSPNDN